MKTRNDYMNDPRLLNDPTMKDALGPEKEVHAYRLALQDDMEGMTLEERVEYINRTARESIEKAGLSGKVKFVDTIGDGKTRDKIQDPFLQVVEA
jgi:hypothetical protein